MNLLRNFNEKENFYEVINICTLEITTYTLEEITKVLENEKIKGCYFKDSKLTFRSLIKAQRLFETNISDVGLNMTIVRFYRSNDISVRFDDGTVVDTTYPSFKNGKVVNPKFKKNKYVGQTNIANNGMKMTIIDYKSPTDITVEFEDGYKTVAAYSSFKSGYIANANLKKNKHVGETNFSNDGQLMTILKYNNNRNVIIRFEDGYETVAAYCHFKSGNISNPNLKKIKRIGETSISKNGMNRTIIDYRSCNDITVKFEDNYEAITTYANFQKGTVKNLNYERKKHIGETSISKDGFKMTIIDYVNPKDVTIKFEDGFQIKTFYNYFKKKKVYKDMKIGEANKANNGQMMIITEYRNCRDITVEFEDGFITNTTYDYFRIGKVKNSKFLKEQLKNKYLGETNIANNGMKMTIVECRSYKDMTVEFEDGFRKDVRYIDFKRGKVSNPNLKKSKA